MLKNYIADRLYLWEKDHRAGPALLSISPTNLCNLQCRSCWQRGVIRPAGEALPVVEMSNERLLQIILEAAGLGVRCVELTGAGEPLMRMDVVMRLAVEIKKAGMIGWMTSNGTLFTPEAVKMFVDMGWDKLTISLDGPDAAMNDMLRPPAGSFDKVMKILSLFRGYKRSSGRSLPDITFNVVVSKHNLGALGRMIECASGHGVNGVTFEPIKVHSPSCEPMLLDFERDHERILQFLTQARDVAAKKNVFTNIDGLMAAPELIRFSGKYVNTVNLQPGKGKDGSLTGVTCVEPWFHMYIEVDGNVRPCCVSRGFGENAKYMSLKSIWYGSNFEAFRNAIRAKALPVACNQCNANLICFSREIQGLLKQRLDEESIGTHAASSVHRRTYSGKVKKMLITDTAPLYPAKWGGPKRIWNLFHGFSPDSFDLSYVGIDSTISSGLKYNFLRIRPGLSQTCCAVPLQYHFWHFLEQKILGKTSLDLFLYLGVGSDSHFRFACTSRDYDVMVCSHPWSGSVLKPRRGSVFVYDAHNCEYMLIKQILRAHPYRDVIARRVFAIEKETCKKSDLVLVCSEKEKDDFISLYSLDHSRIMVVPNGSETKPSVSGDEKRQLRIRMSWPIDRKIILFVGAYYKPNNDAARYLVEILAGRLPGYTIVIAGSVADFFAGQRLPANVLLTGWLTDEYLAWAFQGADIAVNPMMDGSGINIKMLDYMAYGLPIVTTSCGIRGIEVNGRRPFIVSELSGFPDAIRAILSDTELAQAMSQDGRSLISEKYEWKAISKRLEEKIMELVNTR